MICTFFYNSVFMFASHLFSGGVAAGVVPEIMCRFCVEYSSKTEKDLRI